MHKLHLGSGLELWNGWTNIDICADVDSENFIYWDLSRGLPHTIEPESVQYIFSQHFLEHITRHQAVVLLTDCYRKLSPLGVIRIVVPSLDEVVRRYATNDLYTGNPKDGAYCPKNKCVMINDAFNNWGHEYMYNWSELESVLKDAGFSNIEFLNYRESKHETLRNLETRSSTDLIVEATK